MKINKTITKKIPLAPFIKGGLSGLLLMGTVNAGYFDGVYGDDTATGTGIDSFAGTEYVSGVTRINNAASMNNILKSLKYLKNNGGSGKFVDGTVTTDAVFTGGNVGIGTDSPTSKLDVKGDIQMLAEDGTPRAYFARSGVSGNPGYMVLTTNSPGVESPIRLHAGSGQNSWINNAGNFSVGTDSPVTRLHVNGTITMADGGETCDATHIGSMRYKADALTTAGDFQGCVQTAGVDTAGDATDDTFSWKSITGVVQ